MNLHDHGFCLTFENSQYSTAALSTLATIVAAREDPPEGYIQSCTTQACDNCLAELSVGSGFPECRVYESSEWLTGLEREDGDGYDVWWNSGGADEGCQTIIRTPASVDVQNCGYFLTSWNQPGCYKTRIQQTFMIQFCCGTGDCGEATPQNSMANVRVAALQGETSSTSLVFDDLQGANNTGSRELGDGMTLHWAKRTPSSPSLLAKRKQDEARDTAANRRAREHSHRSELPPPFSDNVDRRGLSRRSCGAYEETRRYTQRGEQKNTGNYVQCPDGKSDCSKTVETSVTVGRSISAGASVELFEVISLSTEITFSEEYTSSVTDQITYDGDGYITFSPM